MNPAWNHAYYELQNACAAATGFLLHLHEYGHVPQHLVEQADRLVAAYDAAREKMKEAA